MNILVDVKGFQLKGSIALADKDEGEMDSLFFEVRSFCLYLARRVGNQRCLFADFLWSGRRREWKAMGSIEQNVLMLYMFP